MIVIFSNSVPCLVRSPYLVTTFEVVTKYGLRTDGLTNFKNFKAILLYFPYSFSIPLSMKAFAFFLFICWIIYSADCGVDNVFVNFAHSIPYGDKLGHTFLFGTLAFLTNLALNNRRIFFVSLPLLLGSLLVITFAVVEEFSQIAFELRTFDWTDIVSDLLGVLLFSYGSILLEQCKKKAC